MSLLGLSLAYIRARALNAALNLLLLALGVATIVLLLLFSQQLEQRLTRDARGIDLVIGAKGSPLQLILSSVYHVDAPTGNIPLDEAERWRRHRLVAAAIPLALGDSVAGFRIAGTTHDYVAHYAAGPAAGRLWRAPFEATIGAEVAARTGLAPGERFVGSHGLAPGGGAHADHPYEVVGVLAPSASVLDRLVLTSIESVWLAHGIDPPDHEHDEEGEARGHSEEGEAHGHSEEGEAHAHAEPGRAAGPAARHEITALLVRYASPLAAVQLPRRVNQDSALQAASPAMEMVRLLSLIGVGLDTLRGFGLLLIATAGLSVLIALSNAMQERRYDLAVMRVMGAHRATLFAQPLIEGLILAGSGAVLGVGLGHLVAEVLGRTVDDLRVMGLSGAAFVPDELLVLALALAVGVLAALIPALQAYRTDIAAILAAR